MGNGERGTGNGERGMENGERRTGNGEPRTGVWEPVYSGNPPDNSKWRTDEEENVGKCEKCLGCKGEFLPAVLPDDSTFLLESSRVKWMVCSVKPS